MTLKLEIRKYNLTRAKVEAIFCPADNDFFTDDHPTRFRTLGYLLEYEGKEMLSALAERNAWAYLANTRRKLGDQNRFAPGSIAVMQAKRIKQPQVIFGVISDCNKSKKKQPINCETFKTAIANALIESEIRGIKSLAFEPYTTQYNQEERNFYQEAFARALEEASKKTEFKSLEKVVFCEGIN